MSTDGDDHHWIRFAWGRAVRRSRTPQTVADAALRTGGAAAARGPGHDRAMMPVAHPQVPRLSSARRAHQGPAGRLFRAAPAGGSQVGRTLRSSVTVTYRRRVTGPWLRSRIRPKWSGNEVDSYDPSPPIHSQPPISTTGRPTLQSRSLPRRWHRHRHRHRAGPTRGAHLRNLRLRCADVHLGGWTP